MKKKISGLFLFLLTPCVVLVFPLLAALSTHNYAPTVDQFSSIVGRDLQSEDSFVLYAGFVGCDEECILTLHTFRKIENALEPKTMEDQHFYFINLFDDVEENEAQSYVNRHVDGVTVLNLSPSLSKWMEQLHINHAELSTATGNINIDHPDLFYRFSKTNSGWKLERLSRNHLLNLYTD